MRNQLSAEAAYGQTKVLIESAPDLIDSRTEPEAQQWMGRAAALIEATLGAGGTIRFRTHQQNLKSDIFAPEAANDIMALLYEALAVVELALPAKAQGAFIPAGNALDAFAAVSRIFASAQNDLLIVDPYLDEKILLEFGQLATADVRINLLADAQGAKPTLASAAAKWKQQFASIRPLEVRLAPARSLHDRIILVDGRDVWTVGQSFNALAARAPTSFGRVDRETARLKIDAYGAIWAAATPLK
jgi:hypothetical protein